MRDIRCGTSVCPLNVILVGWLSEDLKGDTGKCCLLLYKVNLKLKLRVRDKYTIQVYKANEITNRRQIKRSINHRHHHPNLKAESPQSQGAASSHPDSQPDYASNSYYY